MEERIRIDLRESYGLTCDHIEPVTGGWLNQKWMITADNHRLLVKQFSNKRYSKDRIELIEAALQRQIILEKSGVPCPHIWQYKGSAIRWLDNETPYMVMDFLPGRLESPDTITLTQMYRLGSACGFMHKAFSQLPTYGVKGFPIHKEEILNSLWSYFHTHMQASEALEMSADVRTNIKADGAKEQHTSSSDAYWKCKEAVLALEPILKGLTTDFFSKLPQGIAHEDFAFDNILFQTYGISAILDFDRNQYSYLWHDIGRAILSFALVENQLNMDRICAFREGYSQYLPLSLQNIADALRISWCIEVPWWLQPEYFENNREKVERFKDEILWLTEHWFALDSIFST